MNIKRKLRKMYYFRRIYYAVQSKIEQCKIPKLIRQRNMNQLQGMKNAFLGKRCFIIGNGPSLTVDDLNKLKGEYTFASNRIYSIYPKTEWRPTFYCIQDGVVLNSFKDDLPEIIGQSKCGFVSMKQYKNCDEILDGVDNAIWFPLKYIPPKNHKYVFSEDASAAVIEGLTVTYSCIQLAAYMGFQKIYLLGVDHNYAIEFDEDGNIVSENKNISEYFTEAQVNADENTPPKVIEMSRAYLSAQKYSQNRNFKVFNATRGGKLDIFERVNIDEIV